MHHALADIAADDPIAPLRTAPPATLGAFVKVAHDEHPLPRASEVAVYFQDYHRSSSKIGRFGRIVGVDTTAREYLVMLDDSECLAIPVRRVEWRRAMA